ncbi:YchJ family protein [Entomohabitans teleogrylli]|uniref:YchJ family protein n=1 Tax=Entomohabitans teleogrylli TaxID=1384589 RepID=UPI00073D400A|nr:YchJ family protein [Entomohabitans teleogrylli]
MSQLCPCGSGFEYSACCQPYLNGERPAPGPSQLMRSRYSAFVNHHSDYLISTWHPSCMAAQHKADIEAGFAATHWLSLTIFEEAPGANPGEEFVSFVARFEENGKPGAIIERSRFLKEGGRWYYIDGLKPQFGRNDLCPCGSGKKFKKCCGA